MKKTFIFVVMAMMLVVSACGKDTNQGNAGGSKSTAAPAAPTAKKDSKTIKVGMGIAENHFMYASMVKFKEYVESKSNGEMKVELFSNNQIGADKDVLEAIKLGTVQMNLPSPAVLANFVKEFNLLTFPYLFPTQEIADKIIDGDVGKELLGKLKGSGFVGLGYVDFGFRHTTNNVRPINTMADFKGIKLRVIQNPVHLDVFRALGANPTAMNGAEIFSGLQQGVIDGQENPLKNIYGLKLHEVQKYLSLDGHIYEWSLYIIGEKFYNGLTDEQKKIVQEATTIASKHTRESVQKEDAAALEEFKKAGLKINEVTQEAKDEMKKTAQPIIQKYLTPDVKSMYDKIMKELSTK